MSGVNDSRTRSLPRVGGIARTGDARWALCRTRKPGARLRLYCFPHSGGSAGEYLRWSDELPDVEVWGIQHSGRGERLAEPLAESMAELVGGLVDVAAFEEPFVFFGHSFGALVAFETARALRSRALPLPELLLPSAYLAPHLPRTATPLHRLPDDELVARLDERYQAFPAELRANPDLMELVLPAYRADFTVLETYRHTPAPPLRTPIVVFGGAQDTVTSNQLSAWSRHTTGSCSQRVIPGGHFYLRQEQDQFMRILRQELAAVR